MIFPSSTLVAKNLSLIVRCICTGLEGLGDLGARVSFENYLLVFCGSFKIQHVYAKDYLTHIAVFY
jgi:hypothetical protein